MSRLDYINGLGVARLRITDGTRQHILTLDKCNVKGQIEKSQKIQTVHETLNRRIRTKIYGYRLKFTLHFDQILNNKEVLIGLERIYNLEISGWTLYLTPRTDLDFAVREFEVISGEELNMKPDTSDRRSVTGMEGIVLEFTTVGVHTLNWIPGIEEQIIISNSIAI